MSVPNKNLFYPPPNSLRQYKASWFVIFSKSPNNFITHCNQSGLCAKLQRSTENPPKSSFAVHPQNHVWKIWHLEMQIKRPNHMVVLLNNKLIIKEKGFDLSDLHKEILSETFRHKAHDLGDLIDIPCAMKLQEWLSALHL